jgi:hypothetical protein
MDNHDFIKFGVVDAADQVISVTAQGRDASFFKSNVSGGDIAPDESPHDPVESFVEAANLGMFAGADHTATASSGRIIARRYDPQSQLQTWQVSLAGVDKGAFRVLVNLLIARDLTGIEINTISGLQSLIRDRPTLNYYELDYPGRPDTLPFHLDFDRPARSAKDRSLQIVFVQEPDERLVEVVYRGLEVWVNILLCGAYPIGRTSPRQAGAIPDLAYQHDAYSIVQAFPEYFGCDEASFNAAINWGQILHARYCPLEQILIS